MGINNSKDGFTLVELSIVLVIIGLLTGGVLAARSMINTAKIQNTIRQLQQFNSAVTNFKTRYNQLPGDSNLFPGVVTSLPSCDDGVNHPVTCPYTGNNDGRVVGGGDGLPGAYPNEAGIFWSHLSLGVGLKSKTNLDYQAFDVSAADMVPDVTCPTLALDTNNQEPVCLLPNSTNLYQYRPRTGAINYYLGSCNGCLNQKTDAVTTVDLQALDSKMDDGNPNTGSLTGESIGYVERGTGSPADCVINGGYNLSSSGYNCSFFMNMDIIAPGALN